jgi:deazaflavin-dependent oxidoreductase (nitroreductase family)
MDKPPPRWFMRLQWRVHRLVWAVSGGRVGRKAIGMPVLELVTIGRRSGQARSILISYVSTSSGPALAGTNAGLDRDPAWVGNLRANRRARVREGGRWRDVEARFLEGHEWQETWERFLEHPGYADYQRMLNRPIPLVVLEDG